MDPEKSTKKAATMAEPSSSVAKTSKSLKPKPKIMKKSPNQNSAKARKATLTPKAEATSIPSSSGTKTPKALKPDTKIMKKSLNQKSAQTKKANITLQVQEKSKDEKKSGQETNKDTKTNNQRNDEKKPKTQERNKEKSLNLNSAKSQERKNKKSINDQEHNEKRQRDHKGKEKLGGLIMMCNGKTKPDCFRYRVMGVPLNKKELVLAIKPGLKLFLYDFDLRLLYGIYTASSSGGMKLEPNAFDGAFPVQVRFKVHKDCLPLPEDVFKKAVKDNYNDKRQRFKTELTVQQVKKLTDLFKPIRQQQSNARSLIQAAHPIPIVHPTPMSMVMRDENRREPHSRVARERFTRDHYSPEEHRYYTQSDRERERFPRHPASSTHIEITSAKREVTRDDPLFLSEKEYRTYGLGRAQHATTSPVRTPSFDPYQNDHHREQFHSHPPSIHRDILPSQKEELSSDPLFLSEKAYRTYGLGREPARLSPPAPSPSSLALDPYQTDHHREQLRRHRLSSHRDILPSQKELSSDPLFLSEKAYRTYGLGREPPVSSPPAHAPVPSSLALDPYSRDPTYTDYYGVSSSDPYTLLSRRGASSSEHYPSSTRRETHPPTYDSLERGTISLSLRGGLDVGGRLYSTYASSSLSDYSQQQNLGHADHAAGSVSSKYSFPGPSVSYR